MKEKGVRITKKNIQPPKPRLKQKMANKKTMKKYVKSSNAGLDMGGPVLTHRHPSSTNGYKVANPGNGRWVTLPNGKRVLIKK